MRNICCEFVKRSGKVSNSDSNKESALAISEALWSGFIRDSIKSLLCEYVKHSGQDLDREFNLESVQGICEVFWSRFQS